VTTTETGWAVIADVDELAALVGRPVKRVAEKVRSSLHELDRGWLAASPFCLIATAASDGSCDVSPKGDPPGFVHVLDEHTIAIPDRPGNRRVDGFRNVLDNPQVGLIFLVPGRTDTLRINGHAQLVREAPFFDDMVVKGHRPTLAMVVHVDEVFSHCSKAFLRSALWDSTTWTPDAAPSRVEIAHAIERPDESVEELKAYYGAAYVDGLYKPTP
jgi:hypothetical protein